MFLLHKFKKYNHHEQLSHLNHHKNRYMSVKRRRGERLLKGLHMEFMHAYGNVSMH